MKKVQGDLLQLAQEGEFDVIVHGCNCHCAMGAGIARTIRTLFPQAYQVDCSTKPGDKGKLGTITYASASCGKHVFTIVNGYTQFNAKGKGVLADYDAIRKVFRSVKLQFSGKRIGYPMIGAGLARGDWKIISAIIDSELTEEDHTVVEYAEAADRKRARVGNQDEDDSAMFQELLDWIRTRGGFVHQGIHFDTERRKLEISEKVSMGTVLMRLPQKSVLVSRPFLPECYRNIKLENEDVILAVYLANNPDEIRPYMNTLPDSSFFSTLPTRWPLDEQTRLLKGSPMLEAVNECKLSLEKYYNQATDALSQLDEDGGYCEIPSKQAFDDAMAYVESRAFGLDGLEVMEGAPIPALVPLLDLCDHRRGRNGERKNLSYSFQDGNVLVKASEDLDADEMLRITYGARSNAHLLLKYGFCLADNIEADGSSNDILRFVPIIGREDGSIELQTGPKAYTFGKFVRALEQFYPRESQEFQAADEKQEESDLEAFLDECDQEENEEFELDEVSEEVIGEKLLSAVPESVKDEIEALAKFEARLLEVAQEYGLSASQVARVLAIPIPSATYHAALLIHSELRTIRFFLLAVRRIQTKLEEAAASPETFPRIVDLSPNDLDTVTKQVQELVDAYMVIRHQRL